jgi:hypothetical protein
LQALLNQFELFYSVNLFIPPSNQRKAPLAHAARILAPLTAGGTGRQQQ